MTTRKIAEVIYDQTGFFITGVKNTYISLWQYEFLTNSGKNWNRKNISFIWNINYPVVVVYDTSLYESG